MKSISTINPAIMENTDGMIVKVCAPVIDIKVGVLVSLTQEIWHDLGHKIREIFK